MNSNEHPDPIGIEFFDVTSRRVMKLVLFGQWANWIVYRHPDGQWVSLRRCSEDDAKSVVRSIKMLADTNPREEILTVGNFNVGLLAVHQ